MIIRLADLRVGQRARIIKIEGRSLIKRRLLEMGVEPGAIVRVERIAPLGDPIEVSVKGYYLTLRRSEARSIVVEVINE